MKILYLDTEFSNYRQLLSTGAVYSYDFKVKKIEEEFFANKTDNRTLKIHGLDNDFLKKNGKRKPSVLRKEIFHQKYVCGFGVSQDFEVLKVKTVDLFQKGKVIDLRLIIDAFGYQFSLSDFANRLGLLEKYKCFLPIHTAVMDSYICFLILRKIVFHLQKNLKRDEILELLSHLSSAKYSKEFQQIEKIINKLKDLGTLFKKIAVKEKVCICDIPDTQLYFNDNTLIFNKDEFIIAKYKGKIDFNLKEFKKNTALSFLNLGYKGVTNV